MSTGSSDPAARPTPRPAGRRWALRVGTLLLLAGVAGLAYVGWQTWGTTWLSERTHRETVADLEDAWADDRAGAPSTLRTGDGVATAVVRIPRFGEDYAVPVLVGTSDEVLAAGFGHFRGTADPGEEGNFALAGHRITHGEPLARMPELRPGDEVVVETAEAVHTYVLDTAGDALRIPFTETWVVDRLPDNPDAGEPEPAQRPGQALITLTTCAELFATDDRLVAFGHLVSSVPRDAA